MLFFSVAAFLVGAQASAMVPPFGSVVKVALVSPGIVVRDVAVQGPKALWVVVANERENTANITLEHASGSSVAATIPAYSEVRIILPLAGTDLCALNQVFQAPLRIVKMEEAVDSGYVVIQTHSVRNREACREVLSPRKGFEKQDER